MCMHQAGKRERYNQLANECNDGRWRAEDNVVVQTFHRMMVTQFDPQASNETGMSTEKCVVQRPNGD